MAKNISLMGASYSDVPAIILPQTGGGTARFDDASVTTATASDVAQGKIFLSADGTITTGSSSGGGSPIQLLYTLTVAEDSRSVSIITTSFNSYDFYFCLIDATLTASDWLYIAKNGNSTSGGSYQQSSQNPHGIIFLVSKYYSSTQVLTTIQANNGYITSYGAPDNMFIYTYTATKLIKAGSKFKIYGANFADV